MYTASMQQLIIGIIVAALIGCAAGILVGGGGKGILGNAVFGVLGCLFASWLFPMLGVDIGGKYSFYVEGIIGTMCVIIILNVVKKIL